LRALASHYDSARQRAVSNFMQRRTLLITLGCASVAACANRPPKPPLKPNALQRIGMLPLKEWPDGGSTAQFNRLNNPPPKDQYAPPPITPQMLGMAIGASLKNARNAELARLGAAVATTGFEPGPTLRQALQAEFERRSVRFDPIGNPALDERIRNGELKDLPTSVDAIVDVQIHSAGYYDIGKGQGFTPYASVTARVIDTVNSGEIFDEFSYSADYNDAEGSTRHFTTPRALSQPDLAAFSANAMAIRAGLTAVLERVAAKLVDDIVRVQNKLPRLE
jgi:hypothetical protein